MDASAEIARWFNPRAEMSVVRLGDEGACHVIDHALLDPEGLVDWVAARRDDFRKMQSYVYPGIHLDPPPDLANALRAIFQRYVRQRFDARQLLDMQSRFSMVTLQPDALLPIQWLCHSDKDIRDPSVSIQASLLYLYDDPALGGTSFYRPRLSHEKIAALFRDAATLSARDFTDRYGIEPGFMGGDNDYFERIGQVEARWNRLIFYDANILHSGDIPHPQRLSADPATGRLTYNGFFTSLRHAVRA